MRNIYLSIVIPAFKEEENIKSGVLEKVWNYLKEQKYTWEVLIVDDGSSDNTADLAEKFARKHEGFKVLKEPHRGKGGTVMAGMLNAKGKIILFTDMDQATPIEEIDKFLLKFEDGFDIVIGSRSGREGAPLVRKMMAFGFSLLRTLILGLPFKDTQCGFKAFKRDAAKKIFGKLKIFSEKREAEVARVDAGFDLEVLYIARKLGFKVAEVPVIWHHKGTERVNPISDSINGLRDLLRVRLNAVLGKYNS